MRQNDREGSAAKEQYFMSVLVNGDVVRVTHAVRKQPCDSAHSSQLTAAHCCHYTYMQAVLNITIKLHVLKSHRGGKCA